MIAFRLEKKKHEKVALKGIGAKINGGRWNSIGHFVVYASESIALAALEVLANAQDPEYLEKTIVLTLDIPEKIIQDLERKDLPAGWERKKTLTRAIGDRWIRENQYAVLRVPSVLVPKERNLLINPKNPEAKQIKLLEKSNFRFDPRLKRHVKGNASSSKLAKKSRP